MKNYCFTILIFFILSSCATLKLTSDSLRGTYAQVEKAGYKFGIDLILNKGTFALVDHHDYRKNEYNPYRCCDTIAFGVWKLDENHMTVDFSTPDYSYTVLSSNLKEEVDSIKKDSIVFMITNPIEKNCPKSTRTLNTT